MDIPKVTVAQAEDRERVLSTLALAFSTDPVMRWMLPTALEHVTCFPRLITAFAGHSLGAGATFVAEEFAAVSMWVPPGVEPEDKDAMHNFVVENVRPEKLEVMGELTDAMGDYHPDDESCWYLPAIGVDPQHQGRGLGSALLKHVTRMLDDAGAPGYLESSNPRNVSLYKRHGFEEMGEIRVGDCPPVTPMLRAPR